MKCLAKLAQEKSELLSHNIIDYFFKNHEKSAYCLLFSKNIIIKKFLKNKNNSGQTFLCPQILREKEKKLYNISSIRVQI
jgi:hypothetical protein